MKEKLIFTSKKWHALLSFFLLLIVMPGKTQSVQAYITRNNSCEGFSNYLSYNFTPPSNVASYQITSVNYVRGSTVIAGGSNWPGSVDVGNYQYSATYYVQVNYTYTVSYQYQCGSYCCKYTFGICAQNCPIMCTGYNTYSGYVYSNAINVTVYPKSKSTKNDTVCSNNLPYVWNGNNYYSSGTYNKTFAYANARGCDSIATLNLTVVNGGGTSNDSIILCQNRLPYLWNGISINSAGNYSKTIHQNFCDSTANLKVTVSNNNQSISNVTICANSLPYVWNNNNYTNSGSYNVTFTGVGGCDSTATLNLTVNPNTTSTTTDTTARLPYVWNGNTYNAAGSYNVTLTNSKGCDSIATLNLFVKLQTDTTLISRKFCQNISFPVYLGINSYDGAYSYVAIRGFGAFSGTVSNSRGGDSVIVFNISPLSLPVAQIIDTTICSKNLPFTYRNKTYTNSITDTITKNSYDINICDSTFILKLKVNPTTTSITTVNVCQQNLPYIWNGNSYNSNGTYNITFVSSTGCDSIATLNLTVRQNTTSTTNAVACRQSLPFMWNGNSYNTSGAYLVHLQSYYGCDSAATLNLSIISEDSSFTTATICRSQLPYNWNGATFQQAGKYLVHLTTKKGCDSLAYLYLNVMAQIKNASVQASVSTTDSVCYSSPITFTAQLNIDSSFCNISNNLYAIYWKANTPGPYGSTSLGSGVNYINTTSSGKDTIFFSLVSQALPGTSNTYCSDGGYLIRSVNSFITKVKTPKVMPVLTIKPTYPSYPVIIDSKTGILDKNMFSLCSVNDYFTIESNVANGIWGIQDTNKLKIVSFINNNKQTATIKALGINGTTKVFYTTNENGCSITLSGTVAIDTINLLQNAMISGPTETCQGNTINFTSSYSGGFWSANNVYLRSGNFGEFLAIGATHANSVVDNGFGGTNVTYYINQYNATGFCRREINKRLVIWKRPIGLPLPTITAASSICVGSTIQASSNYPNGLWRTDGRASVDNSGKLVANSVGTFNVFYTASVSAHGCINTNSKQITINPLPAVPSIAYAPNTPSPQTTSIGGVISLCNNRTFTLVGSPVNGVWTKTGVVTITPAGTASTNTVINTGNITGPTGITYSITDANGCKNSKTFVANVVTCASKGIASQTATSNEQLVIYPNPAHSVINVNVKTLSGTGSILLTDLYGKTVKQQPLSMGTNTINVNHLAKGMYLVSIITEQGKQTQKIVVE